MGDPRAAAAAPASSLVGGRTPTVLDRNCFAAMVYMARTSTPWRLLPVGGLGCGSEATVRRRLVEWSNAGVFERLHDQLLDRLGAQGLVGWSRASLDTMSVRAKRGGPRWRNPVDRGKTGSKLHLIVDGQGLPLVPATARTTAPPCDSVGSPRGLPGVEWSRRPPLAGIAGRSSGRCRG
jgi:transposase